MCKAQMFLAIIYLEEQRATLKCTVEEICSKWILFDIMEAEIFAYLQVFSNTCMLKPQ